MTVTIKELRALAKRVGVDYEKRRCYGHGFDIPGYGWLYIEDAREHGQMVIMKWVLLGIIAKKEGLL